MYRTVFCGNIVSVGNSDYYVRINIAVIFYPYAVYVFITGYISAGRFFLFVEEVLFWVALAFSVFLLMQTKSNGTIRWFAVLGAVVGILFYKKTISDIVVHEVSGVLIGIKNKLTASFKMLKMKVTGRH